VSRAYVTGNHAAGYALAAAGEANRGARGCCGGAYPITPQTEIIEYLMAHAFGKGSVVPVESEHSAMGVCIGAALAGARAFTASSANGLLYMMENVFAAGYYRLPVVMVVSNRTLGPPWNIWADQGDSLALRDAPWLQFYCDSHQDLVDTILVAFRIAEDRRVLLPAIVAQDGFLLSHTQMVVDLPEQELVDAFLPALDLPHHLDFEHPRMYGGMTWPRDTQRQRADIQAAMDRVPEVLDEVLDDFERLFGRRPAAAFSAEQTDDADTVVVACNTLAETAREVVRARRAAGEKVGLVRVKLFRPFLREALVRAVGPASRVAVLDRNHSPGSGGIFWNEIATSLRSRPDVVLQDYIVGLGGSDVAPAVIDGIIRDVGTRDAASEPVFITEAVA
jgi:pyruvate/2-oxoacid:ferredoxin oxidoreductase alpha subunit